MYVQHEEVYYLFDNEGNEIGVEVQQDHEGIDVTQEVEVKMDMGGFYFDAQFEVQGLVQEKRIFFKLYA